VEDKISQEDFFIVCMGCGFSILLLSILFVFFFRNYRAKKLENEKVNTEGEYSEYSFDLSEEVLKYSSPSSNVPSYIHFNLAKFHRSQLVGKSISMMVFFNKPSF
jgi:hypothetical protein